jgi:GntR family transcriptional regulator / MocR family aminotransferase
MLPVPVVEGGLDLNCLRSSGAGLVYLTPSHQLPLGHVMPVANRLGLLEWAESGGNFIFEDDYDSELRYHGKPIPSLQGLRPNGNVIYSGTFSKVLSPALRLSYLVLPDSLLAQFRRLYGDYFALVPLLEQRTMASFMALGHWERHIRRMRIIYKRKHDALIRAVESHFGTRARLVGQGAGLHVVLILPDSSRSEAEIIARAREKSIRLLPISDFYAAGRPDSTTLLLGFGGLDAGGIERSIGMLAQLCW